MYEELTGRSPRSPPNRRHPVADAIRCELPTRLTDIRTTLPASLREILHLVLDLDGMLYRGGTLFPWTAPFLETVRELGIGVSFVTNNSSRSREGYVAHFEGLGIQVRPEQVFTSGQAAIELRLIP